MCILGDVVEGTMRLSETGKIVETCWKEISAHFQNTRVDVFQVMPNHVHGIIEIKEIRKGLVNQTETRRGEVASPIKGDETSPLQKITLGKVVAYFKYQATKHINEANGTPGKKVFQRNYHDHIIRSDIDHFFIQQYIELNPLLWHLDSNNPDVHQIPIDELKRSLKERHGLDDYTVTYLIDWEMNYREWQELELSTARRGEVTSPMKKGDETSPLQKITLGNVP